MLFTRTIRRKMMVFLALVLTMLVALALGSISGLSSYRNAVRDLDFSINDCPRQRDVALAVGRLHVSLLQAAPGSRELVALQAGEFRGLLDTLVDEIDEYRRKLRALPPSDVNSQRTLAESLLVRVDETVVDLKGWLPALGDPATQADAKAEMLGRLNQLIPVIIELPDYQKGVNATLTDARESYRAWFLLVCVTSAVVVLLFLGLVRYGWVGVFQPLRRLHQGAIRVARGDFDYRVRINSRDEMAELAESFNQMTARFQEITQDLDRQVRERSKQLVRSERLAGIGFLAAGVAHEINNPLSAMAMAAESLEYRLSGTLASLPAEDAEVIRQYLRMMQTEASRCQQITTRLLDFARGNDQARHRCDLTSIVREVIAMVGHMSKYRDRKIEFARAEPCYAEVSGPEIKQVVLNLVSNGLESMDVGRTLRVGVVEQTDQVVITFRDEGCGMTEEVLENLFEPFFTQRKDGKGTGLGLSISQRIIGDHGGTIEALSDGPGQGSTFLVHLPRKAVAQKAA